MAKAKSKRKTFDWESIEKRYRAGIASNCALAREFGCAESTIRKRAKVHGWKRDLTDKVRVRVREKLVRTVRSRTAEKEEEFEEQIIEDASDLLLVLLREHQKITKNTRDAAASLLEDLKAGTFKFKKLDDKGKAVEVELPLKPTEKATLLNAVSNSLTRIIALERQANNLQDGFNPDPGGDDENDYTKYPSTPLTLEEWEKQIAQLASTKEHSEVDAGSE